MAITSIAANGWMATYSGTPPSTVLDEPITVTQPGYDNTGAAANDTRSLLVTQRIRNAGLTTYSANTVGLSLRVVANSTSAFATVASTAVSPSPVCAWTCEFRKVIGSGARTVSATGAQYHFKLDGRPLACMIFSATDGTTTVYQTATTMVVGGESTDAMPVHEYKATFSAAQMASLTEGLITYNCRAIPWVGDNTAANDIARSIANTADWSARGQLEVTGWSPRYDVKDVSRFATQPRCYVDAATGSNSTGKWGTAAQDGAGGATDPSLFPFATVAGALTLTAANGPAAGSSAYLGSTLLFDGCRIRIKAGTQGLGTAAAGFKAVKCAALIVERDPAVSRAAAIIDLGITARLRIASFSGVPNSALTFSDISITRSAGTILFCESGQLLQITMENCNFDNNNQTSVIATTGASSMRYHGTSPLNCANVTMQGANYFRGGTMGGASISVTSPVLLGARILDAATINMMDNAVHMGVFATVLSNVTSPIVVSASATSLSNVFRALCVYEMAQATTATAMERMSGDAQTVNTFNHIKMHCTTVGYSDNGRENSYYVDNSTPTGSRDRTHQWIREENSIFCQVNSKHDLFAGGPVDALRTGGWERLFGVGHNGNWTMYLNAANSNTPSSSFGPEYEGPQSNLGTSISVKNDPMFVAPAHASASGLAGAGGGNYALQTSSPARTLTLGPALPGFGTAAGAVAPTGVSTTTLSAFGIRASARTAAGSVAGHALLAARAVRPGAQAAAGAIAGRLAMSVRSVRATLLAQGGAVSLPIVGTPSDFTTPGNRVFLADPT